MLKWLLFFVPVLVQGDPYSVHNEIPPRLQWEENGGYCGEVSFISAGLYYGQYASQYDVRALVGDQQQELLIGYNDQEAARKMHLTYRSWDQERKTADFLSWVKKETSRGNPVIIGVYMNMYLFYGDPNPLAGSDDYDHIVPVTGISSDYPLFHPQFHPDDELYFSDNGLWSHDSDPPYDFSYLFGPFQGSRRDANREDGEIYTLPNDTKNYGIAITGVVDLNGETLPVRIETNRNDESPPIGEGSETRPRPNSVELTITVSDLEPHVPYVLYRYNDFDSVPDGDFNAQAGAASEIIPFQIESGTTYSMKQTIDSDEIAIYRAVRATYTIYQK